MLTVRRERVAFAEPRELDAAVALCSAAPLLDNDGAALLSSACFLDREVLVIVLTRVAASGQI